MRHLLTSLLLLALGITAWSATSAILDTDVAYGVLPNGLTYYVRHNGTPQGQAEFYIAQKVGSILEEESQRGLAHFLEHMAFNGTKHYPGKELHNYLEGLGVRWGWDFNAYTGVDQTVYNISNVPLKRPTVIDSCLLVLHDWACDITLSPAEIDAERSVIHEEWRRGGKDDRLIAQLVPQMYPTSRFGQRLPIGLMSVVDSFPHQALIDYYHKWYRPDQQAIIVVGDVDTALVVDKIKTLFGPIAMPANPAPRQRFAVPSHQGTILATAADPEQTATDMWFYFLADSTTQFPHGSVRRHIMDFFQGRAQQMLNDRLDQMAMQPDAPFTSASVSFGDFYMSNQQDALWAGTTAKPGRETEALQTLYREVLRAARHGFTEQEYHRALNDFTSQWDSYFANSSKLPNSAFVNKCLNHFLMNDRLLTVETDYNQAKLDARIHPLDSINTAFRAAVKPDNRVLAISSAPGTILPGIEALAAVDAEEIAPYVDQTVTQPMISHLPKAGKIVKETKLPQWEAVELTLSNGAKVVIRPNDYMPDQIVFGALAPGGFKAYGPEYDATIRAFDWFPLSVGPYNSSQLQRDYLNGKNISLGSSFGSDSRTLYGSTDPRGLSSLMEYLYAYMTQPSFDANEFEAARAYAISILEAREPKPEVKSYKMFMQALYPLNSRQWLLEPQQVKEASIDQALKMQQEMTANAADYTFLLVGNVDLDSVRPLVEQYIATLPSNPKTAVKKFPAYDTWEYSVAHAVEVTDSAAMPTPMTFVTMDAAITLPYNFKNKLALQMIAHILSTSLNIIIREELGATYAISAQDIPNDMAQRNMHLRIVTPLKPQLASQAVKGIKEILASAPATITQADLEAARQYLSKDYEGRYKENPTIARAMQDFARTGQDFYNSYNHVLQSVTLQDLKDVMNMFNNQNNITTAILKPQKP